jgi:hypothetical protein
MNKYNRKNKEQEESNLTTRLLSRMGFLDMPILHFDEGSGDGVLIFQSRFCFSHDCHRRQTWEPPCRCNFGLIVFFPPPLSNPDLTDQQLRITARKKQAKQSKAKHRCKGCCTT